MTHIYAITNQKGGVGKTTTAVNLSAYLAEAGKRVLLVDMDPQANATSSLGINKANLPSSSYEILLNAVPAAKATLRNGRLNLSIVPSSTALAAAEIELVGEIGREHRLRQALDEEKPNYDYIIIDCPPSLSLLTVNALVAADGVLVPVQTEFLPLEGLSQLQRTIQLVRQRLNTSLTLRGVILTMYDGRTQLAQQVANEVEKSFGALVFKQRIPRSVRLSEAPSHGQPILTYAPNSPGGLAYFALTQEMIQQDQPWAEANTHPAAASVAG